MIFAACLLGFLAYLAVERVRLERARRRIPLRIAVTGTRGKSGVTRLIAAGLRESGRRVLAKTTGSRPVLILPDGTEEDIPRPGRPSIREQAWVVRRAAAVGADALVVEMMSIGGECLRAESRRIVRPGLLALTNVRLDHLDDMGRSREDIARTLSAAFAAGAAVFVPAEEVYPVFRDTAARLGSRLEAVAAAAGAGGDIRAEAALPFEEFEPNIRLALAVLAAAGVDRKTALGGMRRAAPDFGGLRLWRGAFGAPPRPVFCASAFAANEPESSAAVLARVRSLLPPGPRPLLGVLCLREDRGDRTLQWIRAAAAGFFSDFEAVAVLGSPAPAAARKMRRLAGPAAAKFSFFANPRPAELMARLVSRTSSEPAVVGLGNIAGPGERLIRYWEKEATAYGR